MQANMKHEIYKEIEKTKLLPLYTATDLSILGKLEELLIKNNVKLIEVTYRSSLASDAIKKLAKSNNLIVGAGTVRSLEQARDAVNNGAKFIVSPALIPEVVTYCIESNIPVFPGVSTAGDIQRATEYGIKVVKFFPANISGGLKAINALSGPYYDVKFLPTGGINENNYLEYIQNENIIAVGGSFIISESALMKDNGTAADKALAKIVETIQKNG